MHSKAIAAIFSQPWAILRESLDQIIAIANRDASDLLAAAEVRKNRATGMEEISGNGKTAVIPVFGPIIPRASYFDAVSGATSIAALTAALDGAVADPEIKNIVFNIDSPGGQVTGVHEFATRIEKARAVKPVQAYVSGMAASAAYWIATATGRITADETAEVGSIGVLCAWTDDSAAKEKQGLKDYVIVSSQSPNKHLDPKTKAGRSELQRLVDELGAIFIADVARYRGTDADTVNSDFGQGRVLLARSALAVGMIDAVGVMDSVIEGGCAPDAKEPVMSVATGTRSGKAVKSKKPKADDDDEKPGKDEEENEEQEASEPAKDEENEEREDEASEETDEEEEDGSRSKAGKGKKTGMTLQRFKAAYPAVYNAAVAQGVERERARIRGINDLGIVGHKELVRKAIFESSMDADAVAVAVVKADGKMLQKGLAAVGGDARQAYAKPDPVGATTESGASEEDMLAAFMAGKARK